MSSRPPVPDSPQLDLLGGDSRPAEVHRLFFALVPDAATRAELAHAAASLKAAHPGLRARWVQPGRYHATLHFLGDHPMLRPDIVAAARGAADTVRCEPFAWTLDYAASFHGRQPPCVLRSSAVPAPLQQLWQDLRRALILAGQGGHLERGFAPHVTVAYSRSAMLDAAAIEPLVWHVAELALIHSVVGQGDYQELARWSLASG
jgi:2'-5' RNA ligase